MKSTVPAAAVREDGVMPITPDTKDWTWVLSRRCPDCGYDASTIAGPDVAGALRDQASRWPGVLARPDARVRPNDETWSPLEYGAHVRDVLRLGEYRVGLMLKNDDPEFPNWDQDETALAERYDEQDPTVVAAEILDAAESFAAQLDAVTDEQWDRPGRRSDGARFTVQSFTRYELHDVVHHGWDVGI
jgi:hypothetical protein